MVYSSQLRLRLVNRAPVPTSVVVFDGDVARFQHQVETERASVRRSLSGQMLLCNQARHGLHQPRE